MRLYSASTQGFYDSAIHGTSVPGDAVQISQQQYEALLLAQSQGKEIKTGVDGQPYAAEKVFTTEEVKAAKLADLATYRWTKETEGITVSGVAIKTDRESQSLINGALKLFDLNPALPAIDWKGANGWVQVDRATLEAVGLAVGVHVQACFTREKYHAEAIGALTTIEDIEAYDFTTGWPV